MFASRRRSEEGKTTPGHIPQGQARWLAQNPSFEDKTPECSRSGPEEHVECGSRVSTTRLLSGGVRNNGRTAYAQSMVRIYVLRRLNRLTTPLRDTAPAVTRSAAARRAAVVVPGSRRIKEMSREKITQPKHGVQRARRLTSRPAITGANIFVDCGATLSMATVYVAASYRAHEAVPAQIPRAWRRVRTIYEI